MSVSVYDTGSQLTTAGLRTTVPEGMTTQDNGSWEGPVERLRTPPASSCSSLSFPHIPAPKAPALSAPARGTMGSPSGGAGNDKRGVFPSPNEAPLSDRKEAAPKPAGEGLGQPSVLRSRGLGLREVIGRDPPIP